MKLPTAARWPLPTISLALALFAITATGPGLAAPPPQLRLEGLQLSDHRGRVWTLQELLAGPNTSVNGEELLVVAFLGTECPLAKLYATSLSELSAQYARRGVRVVGVISNRQDSLQKIAAFVDRQRIAFPVLKDPRNRFADTLGAERTPEVFLFDAQRTLRYWGRIDDRYGIGYARDQAQREDLKLAIEDVLAGREVAVARTRSVGCTAVYDNSAANLNNPDPQRTVRWGDQTWDEMMIGYFHYATPRQRTVACRKPGNWTGWPRCARSRRWTPMATAACRSQRFPRNFAAWPCRSTPMATAF